MIVSFFVLIIACTSFIFIEIADYKKNLENQLLVLTNIIADNNTANILFNAEEDANNSLMSLRANKNIISACIYNIDNRVIGKYIKNGIEEFTFPLPKNKKEISFGNKQIEIYSPIYYQNEKIGTIYLTSDLKELYGRVNSFIFTGIAVFIVALLIALLIALYLQPLILNPILKLADLEKRVSTTKE